MNDIKCSYRYECQHVLSENQLVMKYLWLTEMRLERINLIYGSNLFLKKDRCFGKLKRNLKKKCIVMIKSFFYDVDVNFFYSQQRVVTDKNCEWRESFIFGTKICSHAGKNEISDARGYCCQPCQSC